ncbi:MAG: acetyl-CoA carboxylase carboxyltransferase subunit beta [Alphaproteobacteria bacterium]|nr:acetyl-CoA carboxylase carboxyltransferase subunit beta [Alphaproteobacteria bacterium]MBV9418909.1 acetyl-CoA carboxylase carboxyltransferase subunit beta [Alphaproteobacteria bacterium]
MNWIANFVRPRIKSLMGGTARTETPENLWKKCSSCGEMIFHRDLALAQNVCPQCGHHMRIGPIERFTAIFDQGSFEELPYPEVPVDPLKFRGEKRYTDEIKASRGKTSRNEALTAARGTIEGMPVMIAVQPFDFLGGSLSMGVGEGIVRAIETAVAEKRPFILFVSSGGARMQEGILSLMQLPRTTIAVDMLHDAGLPYIVVLTDPTYGGVSASYAMLGDVAMAEPGAQIGFAGPRVIANTIRERLPDGFQRAEYLLEHGMIDMVVPRTELRATLSRVIHLMMKRARPRARPVAVPPIVSATATRLPTPTATATPTTGSAAAE